MSGPSTQKSTPASPVVSHMAVEYRESPLKPARPPQSTQEENQELEQRKTELRSGILPKALADQWQIADPNHPAQLKFERDALALLRKVTPSDFWDFDKDPVRIMYSESPVPNAWIVTAAQPPIIVVTRGMFRTIKGPTYTEEYFKRLTRGLPDLGLSSAVRSETIHSASDLVAVVFHELVHAQEERRRGEHQNSKWEEAQAYARPIEAMHRAGLDPHAMFRVMFLLSRPETSHQQLIGKYADAHPTSHVTLRLIRSTLTGLSYERGALSTDPTVLRDVAIDFESIKGRAQEFHFQHSIRSELPPDYEKLQNKGKIAAIMNLVRAENDRSWPHFTVAAELIEELDIKPREYRDLIKLRDHIVEGAASRTGAASAIVYFAIQTALGENPRELPPQLSPVADAARTFIESITDTAKPATIEKFARQFVEASEESPITRNSHGRAFVQFLTMPQFEDALPRTLPPWHRLRALAVNSQTVLHASLLLGLQRDPFFAKAIETHPRVLIDIPFAVEGEGASILSEMSVGPAARGNRALRGSLGAAQWSKDGRLITVDTDTVENFSNIGAIESINEPQKIDPIEVAIYGGFEKLIPEIAAKGTVSGKERELMERGGDLLRAGQGTADIQDQSLSWLSPYLATHFPIVCSDLVRKYIHAGYDDPKELFQRQEKVAPLLRAIIDSENGRHVFRSLEFDTVDLFPSSAPGSTTQEIERGKADSRSKSHFPVPELLLSVRDSVFTPQELTQLFGNTYTVSNASYIGDRLTEGFLPLLAASGRITTVTPDLPQINAALKIPDAHFFEVDTLLRRAARLIEAAPIEQRTALLIETIDATSAQHTGDSKQFKNLMDERRGEFPGHISSAIRQGEITAAARDWFVLSTQDLLRMEDRRSLIASFQEAMQSMPSSKERLEARILLIAGLREEDYGLQPRLLEGLESDLSAGFGVDTRNSDRTRELLRILEPVSAITSFKRRTDLLETVSRAVLAQTELAIELRDIGRRRSAQSERAEGPAGMVVDMLMDQVAKEERESVPQRKALMEFLLKEPSVKGTRDFLRDFYFSAKDKTFYSEAGIVERLEFDWSKSALSDRHKDFLNRASDAVLAMESPHAFKKLSPQVQGRITEFYDHLVAATNSSHLQYTESSLSTRTIILHEILFPDGMDDEVFSLVRDHALRRISGDSSTRGNMTRDLGRRYFDAIPDIKKDHLATATIVASSSSENRSLGETLVDMASALDPAAVKLVQRMRGMREIPLDIRRDTAAAVFRVGEPDRLDVLKWVDSVKEDLEARYRQHLRTEGRADDGVTLEQKGAVVGCGSMGVNIRVRFSNGDSHILYLLRPYAVENGQNGFENFGRMAKGMPEGDSRRPVLENLLGAAGKRLELEGNVEVSKLQYDAGVEKHRGGKVRAFGIEFDFDAPRVLASNSLRTTEMRNCSYFLMEEMPGKHLAEILNEKGNPSPETQAMCAAILCRELHLYLKHLFVEPDRNEGNIKAEDRRIAHIDFKALRVHPWKEATIREVAPLVVSSIVDQVRGAGSFSDFLGRLGSTAASLSPEARELVTELETGLMSLAPYAEKLSTKQLLAVAVGALEAGLHPELAREASKQAPKMFQNAAYEVLTGGGGMMRDSMIKLALGTVGGDLAQYLGQVKVLS